MKNSAKILQSHPKCPKRHPQLDRERWLWRHARLATLFRNGHGAWDGKTWVMFEEKNMSIEEIPTKIMAKVLWDFLVGYCISDATLKLSRWVSFKVMVWPPRIECQDDHHFLSLCIWCYRTSFSWTKTSNLQIQDFKHPNHWGPRKWVCSEWMSFWGFHVSVRGRISPHVLQMTFFYPWSWHHDQFME